MIIFKDYASADKYLLSLGFAQSRSNFNKGECAAYQKRYKDENGIKYFIDCLVYDWRFTERIPYDFSIGFSGQFYRKDYHDAMNIEFISWELEDVENYIEEMFNMDMLDYYEED